MKATIKVKKEIEIKYVQLNVSVRYEDEDMPYDFPFRDNDMWNPLIDIDKGKIVDFEYHERWPLHMKVTDSGSYYLLDENKEVVLKIEDDYVPNSLIPGSYGDYIEINILPDGTIDNWYEKPSIKDFK